MKPGSSVILILILLLMIAGCFPQPAGPIDAVQLTPLVTESPMATRMTAVTQAQTPVPAFPVDLNILAAASLTDAFSEIGKIFENSHPGTTVVFNFGGSQQLAQQINQGAPADVFASANKKQMDGVIEAGNILTGTQQIFARNRLVVIFPADNPAGLSELMDLAKPNLKLVLAAKEVPVGQYALDFLARAGADLAFGASYQDDVLKNVVSYEDNVKAVLTKVALGEADGGIVYTSDISGEDADKVGHLDIPDALNVSASYPIAIVKESKNPQIAQSFIDLILAPEGQDILEKFNFIPVVTPTIMSSP